MTLPRRALLADGLRALLLAVLAGRAARAQPGHAPAGAPNRTVTLLVGYPPGGQTDFIARLAAPGLAAALGQTVVVENRTGAGGNIATEATLRARPDGATLLAGNGTPVTINPHTFPNLGFDPLRLVPVGMMLESPLVLNVHASVPATDAKGFSEWCKAQPGGPNYGSVGAGSLSHVAMELFRARMGIPEMTHIPYRGAGPANQDFVAGRFSAMFDGISPALPFIRAGQTHGVLVTGERRSDVLPGVATAAEQGLDDFVFSNWIGLFAPPGTPAATVHALNAALNAVLAEPAIRGRITAQGDLPGGGTPEALGAVVRRDDERWGRVVRDHHIRADQ
ncbi:tripartite tricarboxylate transporter substrate binding protein [Roseomonas sp. NAR14]|uniref:Tripartite tricarboxylate transporter substrate binding protein n=1 Tax=Roseomonas acroporae TaxID=2937791 RepID=A0A9X1Y879_9PROT|nr:tripartite tricarboxylate transporter substrate binding protein [Roseomonas acroporae]MCK8785944.1 tripartite tricarboxylate transporter substrate binding protein [Roseomonas acroporae]